jgi:CBS domain-containing protein
VLTDRDLVTRLLAAGLPHDTRVADVMSRHLICCGLDEDLRRAQTRMIEGQVSRLLVVEPSGRCVGVLSLADIARVEDCHESGSTLRAILLRESHGPPTLG